jgi:L-ascorbate metabolism protein UlaG (beta-lactamase superfamily)
MDRKITDFISHNVKYLGVAGIAVILDKTIILVDPYVDIDRHYLDRLAGNPGSIELVDIFISHGHYDHYEYVIKIAENLKDRCAVRIFLPHDVYARADAALGETNATVSSFSQYKKGFVSDEYRLEAVEGIHMHISFIFKLSRIFRIFYMNELKRHFSNPANQIVNFAFIILRNNLRIGHVGSPELNQAAIECLKGFDYVCLSMVPSVKKNLAHIEKLLPRYCTPIHHINRVNGIHLLDNYSMSKLKSILGDRFIEKNVYLCD